MVQLKCLARFRLCFCRWIQHNSKTSNGDISLTASKDGIIFMKFRSVNCLKVIRPLKQLSKVSVRYHSQEYLLRKFSTNYFQSWGLFLVKFHAFTIFLWARLDGWVWSMKINLWEASFLDIKTTFRSQKPHCKIFRRKCIKNESH